MRCKCMFSAHMRVTEALIWAEPAKKEKDHTSSS
jgi:hypothetical protein